MADNIPLIVSLLTVENESIKEYAAGTLRNLSRDHPQHRAAIVLAGCIEPLIVMATEKEKKYATYATDTLNNLKLGEEVATTEI